MKLLSWNIQHGGGSRLVAIAEAIIGHGPDVIALSEFRSRRGAVLCEKIKAAGWPFIESTMPTGIDNGICVLSRTPMLRMRRCPAPPENTVRWLDIDMPEHGFGFAVLHILCAVPKLKDGVPGEAKTRFWNAVLTAAEERLKEPFLFVGDFNTGAHRLDETGKTFVCADHFCRLSEAGWTDVWRYHAADATEWTWYSKLRGGARGNGFRLDHAFASPPLANRVVSCRYSHGEREAKLSDHSMLIVSIE